MTLTNEASTNPSASRQRWSQRQDPALRRSRRDTFPIALPYRQLVQGRRTLGAGQRWLLACLCLLASLAYLTRAPGPSSLSSVFLSRAVNSSGDTRDANVGGLIVAPSPSSPPGMEGSALAHHGHHPSPPTPELTGAAPNAPPAGHDHPHAAHCPFCFTSAFALEADGALLALPGASRPEQSAATSVRPHLAALRHADPRAPPLPRA